MKVKRGTASLMAAGLLCVTAGCTNANSPSATGALLSGFVVRSPIQPVCQEGVPCDAPFSADFTVQKNSRVVAAFRSDATGRFDVKVAPGTYLIVPGDNAPILTPRSQAKQVVVGPEGLADIQLAFDTGIR